MSYSDTGAGHSKIVREHLDIQARNAGYGHALGSAAQPESAIVAERLEDTSLRLRQTFDQLATVTSRYQTPPLSSTPEKTAPVGHPPIQSDYFRLLADKIAGMDGLITEINALLKRIQ